jgi:hypothetical protein
LLSVAVRCRIQYFAWSRKSPIIQMLSPLPPHFHLLTFSKLVFCRERRASATEMHRQTRAKWRTRFHNFSSPPPSCILSYLFSSLFSPLSAAYRAFLLFPPPILSFSHLLITYLFSFQFLDETTSGYFPRYFFERCFSCKTKRIAFDCVVT